MPPFDKKIFTLSHQVPTCRHDVLGHLGGTIVRTKWIIAKLRAHVHLCTAGHGPYPVILTVLKLPKNLSVQAPAKLF